MKRGVAGVRLCDASGCHPRWPCARHPREVGDYQARSASQSDDAGCRSCGHFLCSCESERPKREWKALSTWLGHPDYFTHVDGCVVANVHRATFGGWIFGLRGNANAIGRSRSVFPTHEAAMLDAERMLDEQGFTS